MNNKQILFVISILITCLHSYGMNEDKKIMDQQSFHHTSRRINYFDTLPRAVIRSIFSLTSYKHYPDKRQSSIFSCFYRLNDEEKRAALKTIHTIITIKSTCKKFRSNLDAMTAGEMLKKYSIQVRNELLHNVIWNKEKTETLQDMIPRFYNSKRFFACGLLYSETDFGKKSHDKLVNSALHNNDIQLISFLCQIKKIRLDELSENNTPLFFEAQTVEMAQLCEKNNVNLYAVGSDSCPTILWKVVTNNDIPSSLLQFYLEKDITILARQSDGNSLLHELAIASGKDIKNIDNFIQKAKLLVEKEPELIDDCNYAGETPSDYAENTLTLKNYFFNTTEPAEQFIELLEEHWAKNNIPIFSL